MQIPIKSAGITAVAAGLVMLVRQPRLNRVGTLLVAYGLTWYIGDLQFSENRVLYAIGFCLFFFNAAVMAHIALSFPSGRLRDPLTAGVVISLYCVILITQTARYIVEESPPPQVWGDPQAGTYSPWATAGTVAGMMLCAAVFALLVRRWRSERPVMRRSAAPVWFSAGLAVLIVSGFLIIALVHAPVRLNHLLLFGYATAVLLVPVASQVGALREWVGRANAFDRLADFERAAGEGYRELLAKWLGDPDIQIYPWLPNEERYANPAGGVVRFPADSKRAQTYLEWRGKPLGVLIHDSSLTGARQLQSVATVTRIILEKEALQAEVAQAGALLFDSEMEQRKALQSALHNGGQAHIMGILFYLNQLKGEPELGSGRARELLQKALDGIDQLKQQIREVSFQLFPPALEEYGLQAGVESLYDRLGLPLEHVAIPGVLRDQLWQGDEDRGKRVEHAAYGVISEAVLNARVHAGTDNIRVTVNLHSDRLVVEIDDDGVGGAESPTSSGVGLYRANQLVKVLGGTFELNSPMSEGTHVRVEIPCTS
ncbi:ATP-binding protein [Streptomyces sp. NPDC019990]|uniref:sensor histidine kinase n=1 Tax=Streptomyces sp. NPDC019990 TaxID=3154693 RepID=UPI0033DE4608